VGVEAATLAATAPGLSHSWPEAIALGVRVENHTGLPLVYVGVQVGRFFEAGCTALPQPLPLRSCLYTFFASHLASLLPSHTWQSGAKPRARAVALAELLVEHWLWRLL
jgi:hypothetical protein